MTKKIMIYRNQFLGTLIMFRAKSGIKQNFRLKRKLKFYVKGS